MRHFDAVALCGLALSVLAAAAWGGETASAAAPESRAPLTYRWKADDEHTYKITIKADFGKRVAQVNAECCYVVKKLEVQPPAEGRGGTATAFVVTPDGHLVTCNHVVEGAVQAKVSLGGRQYTADVVDTDFDQDLALIKIPAEGLTPIALADSDEVRKGEEVRAVGFPFSDVLGKGRKVTRGTIAGIVEEEGNRRFHIDAAVNPGNSGGPLVDSQGRAVGVVNAKLMGFAVSQVGFAVPSNEARKMLQHNGIPLPAGAQRNNLTGPALVELVAPSVALVELSGRTDRQWCRVDFSVRQEASMQAINPWLSAQAVTAGPTSHKGQLTVSEFGELTGFSADAPLPFVLGPLPRLAIETLDSLGRSQWGCETQTLLEVPQETEGRFGPPVGFFGRPAPRAKKVYPAIERVRYSLEDDDPDRVIIRKTYEFRTLDDGTNPFLVSRGSGEIVFDKEFGVPRSLDYRGMVVTIADNAKVRIPVNVSYQLRDPAEVAEERRQKELEKKKAEEEREREATVPDPERVAALVADLDGKQGPQLGPPLEELARRAVAAELREQVIDAMRQIIDRGERFHRGTAIKVFCHWASEKQAPLLIQMLKPGDGSAFNNVEIIKTLGQFKTPEVIRAIAARLGYTFESQAAKEALRKIGPEAEDAVLEVLLADPQDDPRKRQTARKAAAAVLQEIGTPKSIEPLGKAQLDEKDWVTRDALAKARNKLLERFPEAAGPAP